MQMTIKQLMMCATALRDNAETMEKIVTDYKKQLEELAHPYEDKSMMPEEDRKTAYIYERNIKEYGDRECAYTLLADAIEEKKVLVNLGVNL